MLYKYETSETETEPDLPMNEKEIETSRQWKIGTRKAPAQGKAKKGSDMLKRLTVGFMFLSWYFSNIYIHPLAVTLYGLTLNAFISNEAHNITIRSFEMEPMHTAFKVVVYLYLNFAITPVFGFLERGIVEASGYTEQEYPLMFKVLYEKHASIVIFIGVCMFLHGMYQWRKRNLKYQLFKTIGLIFFLTYVCTFTAMHTYILFYGGRWQIVFSATSVAFNDTCAYFAGVCFGKHHLIALSPNKTVEGFVGGFFGNIAMTFIVAQWCLQSKFWNCAPRHFNYGLFEDYQCAETNSLYLEKTFDLPFAFMGYETLTVAPALLYVVLITMFSSLVAPFVGFFASGFKRATGIKDFAATLPGHGGFMDRVDCISLMVICNYFLMTSMMQKDFFDLKNTYPEVQRLDGPGQNVIANTIAERFGLPAI